MSEQGIAQFTLLLATREPACLGPGPRAGVLPAAELNEKLDGLFAKVGRPVAQQQLLRALLLLWHDQLDAAHTIAQGIETADGSFVHAVMHRREPDAWNSKYWWRRVGSHPAFPELARRVSEFLRRNSQDAAAQRLNRLVTGGNWDAPGFVDLCDAAKAPSLIRTLQEIQRIETEVLLEYFLAEESAR